MYDWHGNGDNFRCRNGARQPLYRSSLRALRPPGERRQLLVSKRGPSAVRSKLSSRSTTGTGTARTFGVVTGPVSRYVKALFALYGLQGKGDNFWCQNGAHQPLDRSSLRDLQLARERRHLLLSKRGPSSVRSKHSSCSTTATRTGTTFEVVRGPAIRCYIEALFALYNRHWNGDIFWC
ncbi:hypothetical protein L484_001621 [Morus notabilis]|uniref:Uncharacterized protein n=1 Tax=Morus notabilis TaxID=981085 RepID=W9RRD4_9ROSA|nr:hypothetical protein L484_001621 [Morus notabilis]